MSKETRIIGNATGTLSPTATEQCAAVDTNHRLLVITDKESSIDSRLSNLEGYLDAVETKLDSLITAVGNISADDSVLEATGIKYTQDWSSTGSGTSLWTPASGKKFVITDLLISFSSDGDIIVYDGTNNTTNRIHKGWYVANGGAAISFAKPVVSSAANNVLKIDVNGAGSITVLGYEI